MWMQRVLRRCRMSPQSKYEHLGAKWSTKNAVCCDGQYVDWCAGGDKDSFYTNSYCQQIYQNHIKTFVNRRGPSS